MTQLELVNTEQLQRAISNAEKRKYRRVRLPLGLRYMRADNTEHQGVIIDISVNGASIKADVSVTLGEQIIVYIDQLGRFETTVVRAGEDEFAVNFPISRKRTTKLADALTALINGVGEQLNRHRTKRIKQTDSHSVVTFSDGEETVCKILDISVSGASLVVTPIPPIGENLRVGRMFAKVVRHHEDGIGVQFVKTSD